MSKAVKAGTEQAKKVSTRRRRGDAQIPSDEDTTLHVTQYQRGEVIPGPHPDGIKGAEPIRLYTPSHWERGDYVVLDAGHQVHVVAADHPDCNENCWLVVADENDWMHVGFFESTEYVESNSPRLLYRESDRAMAAESVHHDQDDVTVRGALLREAEGLITGDRNREYGEPRENMDVIAGLWNLQIRKKLNEPLTASDVAILMAQVKLSRLSHGVKRDSFVDLAGYAAIGWEVSNEAL